EASLAGGVFKLLYKLAQLMGPLYPELERDIRPFVTFFSEFGNVDYFAFGTLQSPSLIGTKDGVFSIDAQAGTADVTPATVPFMLAVPKPTAENRYARAPYPVVVMGHGLSANRIMALPLANRMAAQGLASACIDLVGHGPLEALYAIPRAVKSLGQPWSTLVRPLLAALGTLVGCPTNPFDSLSDIVEHVFGCGVLRPLFWEGRAIDVDGDGEIDPTAGFFSPNFFRIRDNLRQCAIDQMQLVRALRGLGRDADGNGRLDPGEGDIDGDGVTDLAGPENPVSYMGVSLGGILGGIVMGTEPHVRTGVLNVGGGGLADVMMRTSELDAAFVGHVTREIFGLNVVGRVREGQLVFTFNNDVLKSA
ncbi:MAG: thrombospondin type 3 repeat-containing protein, partial [Actinobacteria bacterium]|nr:thrombospondin type 3 repeat-containing protein [Actinomycetota bacterium]